MFCKALYLRDNLYLIDITYQFARILSHRVYPLSHVPVVGTTVLLHGLQITTHLICSLLPVTLQDRSSLLTNNASISSALGLICPEYENGPSITVKLGHLYIGGHTIIKYIRSKVTMWLCVLTKAKRTLLRYCFPLMWNNQFLNNS